MQAHSWEVVINNFIPFIRPATSEEIEKIQPDGDLTSNSGVWVWPNEGKSPDMAVLRQCQEIDPMYFGETSGTARRATFAWALMNMLRVSGTKEIYFNVDHEGQEIYISLLEKMGAKCVSPVPQRRFKLELT